MRDVCINMSCVEKDTLDNLEIVTKGNVTADAWTFDTAKLSVYGCSGVWLVTPILFMGKFGSYQ